MSNKHSNQKGYVLVSVSAVLLATLAAVVIVNQNYTKQLRINEKTNPTVRTEIQQSTQAQLQAYAEQTNCGADAKPTQDPWDLTISGEKDNIEYSLSWKKDINGGKLISTYTDKVNNTNWQNIQNDFTVYGQTQTTQWILAPYFSQWVEISEKDDDKHHDHNKHIKAKVEKGKDFILRSLKLGPLKTEPIQIIHAELQLYPESSTSSSSLRGLEIQAIKYPWDADDVTFKHSGIGKKTLWPETGFDNFEPLGSSPVFEREWVRFDMTGLINSWVNKTRPNYGWALTSNNSKKFEWVSAPTSDNFEERPRIELKYRCACGEVCVGISQNEVLALGSHAAIHGYGGGRDKLSKLWLHRAHREYLEPKSPAEEEFDRVVYEPAGLSEFSTRNIPAGLLPIGLHIEPSNSEHPSHHYYTLLAGSSATSKWKSEIMQNYAQAHLIYLQSDANKPVGHSLENRSLPPPSVGSASTQLITNYINNSDFYVGGLSDFDNRYWLGFKKDHQWGAMEVVNIPYKQHTDPTTLYQPDLGTPKIITGDLKFNWYHVVDALHVFDQNNFLLSAEYNKDAGTDYESELGHLSFHDGDIVLYNTATQTARLIHEDITRALNNNVHAISHYHEPFPAAGSDKDDFKDTFPMLFETLY